MKLLYIAISTLLLAGCVRTDSTLLGKNTAVISSHGSAFDSRGDVLKGALAEAAKTTKDHGFRYFVFTGSQNETTTSMMYMPGNTYSSGMVNGTASSYGNTTNLNGTYSGSTYTTPGYTAPIVKPGLSATIVMFSEGEIDPDQPQVWDADFILKNQKSK